MSNGLPTKGPITRSSTLLLGADDAFAFQPYLATVAGVAKLRIRSAYLNAIAVATTGDTVDYTLGSVWLYYLDATVDTAGVATAAVVSRTASGLPADTTTHGYQPLFEVNELGAVTSQHVRGSLRHRLCAGAHDFWALGA